MNDRTPDPTLDRLLRHMAWANAALIAKLAEQEDDALLMAAPRNEWTVAMTLEHLVNAAGGYAARLERVKRSEPMPLPRFVADLATVARRAADNDARLRAQAGHPDELLAHPDDPERLVRARSTILAQATHHATEHRAQIAGALATNNLDAIDLDELDLWAFDDAEAASA
jgi:uncharacterized damage-inducible protein DinB